MSGILYRRTQQADAILDLRNPALTARNASFEKSASLALMAEFSCFCNLDAFNVEERARHRGLTERLRLAVVEQRESDTGFAFRMSIELLSPMEITEWILLERRCCPFFTFDLQFAADAGPVWLRLGGGPGVKEFVLNELGSRPG